MARFRFDPQPCFQLSTAAVADPRLRRGSALLVYVHGVMSGPMNFVEAAESLDLSVSTVRSTLQYLTRIGWALDLGDDHLFLDMPLTVNKNGSLREDEYTESCLRYALGFLSGEEPFEAVGTPEQRRSAFQVIAGGQRTGGN